MKNIILFACLTAFIARVSGFMRLTTRTTTSTILQATGVKYGGLHHCGILVRDVGESKSFYMDVFGFEDESHMRPTTLPYPGAFLKIGPDQIHLMQLPNPDPTTGRPAHGGRDRHTALTVNNIDLIKDRLESKGFTYTLSQSGRRALFCRDIDGNAFEFMEDVSLG